MARSMSSPGICAQPPDRLVDWLSTCSAPARALPCFYLRGGCLLACRSKHKQTRSVSEGLRLSIASLADASGYYRSLAYASGCCRSSLTLRVVVRGLSRRRQSGAHRRRPGDMRIPLRGRARGQRESAGERPASARADTLDSGLCRPPVQPYGGASQDPAVINVCVEHST